MHQDLQTLLRCHMRAFAAIGGVSAEILYDRMKTAVIGEDGDGHVNYNRIVQTFLIPSAFLLTLRTGASKQFHGTRL